MRGQPAELIVVGAGGEAGDEQFRVNGVIKHVLLGAAEQLSEPELRGNSNTVFNAVQVDITIASTSATAAGMSNLNEEAAIVSALAITWGRVAQPEKWLGKDAASEKELGVA